MGASVDGDTLDVLVQGRRIRVRLVEIDAPEQDQMGGIRSRQSLISICSGELASVEPTGKDRNGRVLARVICNGTDANAEQVRRGMAWVRSLLKTGLPAVWPAGRGACCTPGAVGT